MEKRNSFSSSLGFVLAAAGSAVGLGNIWRFPYLAAKDGGGLFLAIYIVLALTFGFTMIVTETAIGRKTKQSALTAYGAIHKKSKWIGVFACLVPFMILPYYCIIGGWVLKYTVTFISGNGVAAAQDGYFTGFITDTFPPIIFDVIFLAATAFVIFLGVNKGIESLSKILMPILLIMVIGISIFSLTIKSGEHSGLDGLKVYLVPDFSGITLKTLFITIMDAMGQLFYSISVAMGIMVTYGSYFKDDSNLVKSVNRIEIFDTVVAFLAGVMIIPAVYVFFGKEGMNAGPGLMFVSLPKVFAEMGAIGNVICLGYNKFYFELSLPNAAHGEKGQMLDIMDYVSNNILMPIVAIGTCILVGWIVKPKTIIDEATKNGEKFARKGIYVVMIKYVSPVLLLFLLLGALGLFNKVM